MKPLLQDITRQTMNTLPASIQDTIYTYERQMVFNDVMQELTGNVYMYGACPTCWLDLLSQLQSNPEWDMTWLTI